jgi:8-oxo-dGTP pyrophosphatase MutT (NUDIX family)
MDKLLDPGKLDHIVAGGIPAGLGPLETLVKEAEEEAAISADLVAAAVPVATIAYAMDRHEGLRRDILYCYDLALPADFVPQPTDGEVEGFELWPVDLFVRMGLVEGFDQPSGGAAAIGISRASG